MKYKIDKYLISPPKHAPSMPKGRQVGEWNGTHGLSQFMAFVCLSRRHNP